MARIWRLTKAKHMGSALSGYGSTLRAGRWHEKGQPMVYAAASPAASLLETLVHVEVPEAFPVDPRLVEHKKTPDHVRA